MANETTYSAISSLLPAVYEAALMYAQSNLVMPNVVTVYNDQTSRVDRKFSEYAAGTVEVSVAETTDLSNQAFTRSLLATLSPAEVGTLFNITDARVESDDVMDILSDLLSHIQYTVWSKVEADLAGLLDDFTGGTVGSAGTAISWSTIYSARARLAATGVPGPYNVVLHEYQYYDLATAANVAGLANAAPLRIRDDIQNTYYVGSTSDMDFYTINNAAIAAGTAVKTGIFNRRALALDIRRPLRVEYDRDISLRAMEVVPTMVYAVGAVRTAWGVTILGDATAP